MSRKIRNLAGEPVGAKEADREIRRNMWGDEEKKKDGYPRISRSESEFVNRYFAQQLIIDPSSSVVSTELIKDFTDWAVKQNFQFVQYRAVPMMLGSDPVELGFVRRVRAAEVTGSLLARLDTDTPPTTQKVTVWHGLRWRKRGGSE